MVAEMAGVDVNVVKMVVDMVFHWELISIIKLLHDSMYYFVTCFSSVMTKLELKVEAQQIIHVKIAYATRLFMVFALGIGCVPSRQHDSMSFDVLFGNCPSCGMKNASIWQGTRELDNNIKINKALEFSDLINGCFYERIIYTKLSTYDLELL
ncbi:hypothetical protein Tco_0701527 [Tanacetum coccineum]